MSTSQQQKKSWYEHTVTRKSYPVLDVKKKTDVCVIGAGFTGSTAALELARAGVDVVLLEANSIGSGASGSNGGQLCTGLHQPQDWLEKKFGKQMAHDLWDLSEESKRYIHGLCEEFDIDYQYGVGRVEFGIKPKAVKALHEYCEFLAREYNYDQIELFGQERCREFVDSDYYSGGIHDVGSGHVHPLSLNLGLAATAEKLGAAVYENSAAVSYREVGDKVIVKTALGEVEAEHAILACNGYIGKLEKRLLKRIMVVNDFLVATEDLGETGKKLIPGGQALADTKYHLDYYRMSHDNRLIFGGGASTKDYTRVDIPSRIRKCMLKVFPQLADAKIDFQWSGTLGITMSQLPDIGKFGKRVFYSQGYSGMGLPMALMCGRMMAETVRKDSKAMAMMEKLPAPAIPGGILRNPIIESGMFMYRVLDAVNT